MFTSLAAPPFREGPAEIAACFALAALAAVTLYAAAGTWLGVLVFLALVPPPRRDQGRPAVSA
jgi:hypothetical protein